MKRPLNLRQIEAFKAVIEHGSVSRAAQSLFVSQPAVSKLLTHLEEETGLSLFDRTRGKLLPTYHSKLLYESIERVFSGLQQIEQSVDAIRRDEQRSLRVGVMPALSGSFIRRVTTRFLEQHPGVRVSIETRGSRFVADWLVARKIDVGLIVHEMYGAHVNGERLIQSPLVCAMHPNHALANKRVIRPRDLDGVPFVAFSPESQSYQLTTAAFHAAGARLNIVLDCSTAPGVCEFVADGLGVSLIHPLFAHGMQARLKLRRFDPELLFDFYICRSQAVRNSALTEAFIAQAREVATELCFGSLKGQ
ncbi:LysR substrate-binding domain-containing protein [Alcaligenaceae bacterium A4P071]|nr:LysR substrate-binding domain-containing protein [Alcaligenaceae bacterium A4P071]